MRPREPRQKVLLRARLKAADGWHDACLVDLSRRGAGLQAATAPPRGTYVEIRRGMHVIVARVVWSRGHRFGVEAQDEVRVESLASNRAPPKGTIEQAAPLDRRRLPRPIAQRAEASRNWGLRLQFGFAALFGVGAATVTGAELRKALAAPLAEIGTALDR